MQGVGEDAEVAVEEEDDEEGEDGRRRHLDDGADLGGAKGVSLFLDGVGEVVGMGHETYDSSRHHAF